MAGSPPSLPLQARMWLPSPRLEISKGRGLLYGQGERLRNPAHLMLAIPEWTCFQCSVGGVCVGTHPPLMSMSMPHGLVEPIDLVLCQAGTETLSQTVTEQKECGAWCCSAVSGRTDPEACTGKAKELMSALVFSAWDLHILHWSLGLSAQQLLLGRKGHWIRDRIPQSLLLSHRGFQKRPSFGQGLCTVG